MTEENNHPQPQPISVPKQRRKRHCLIAIGVLLFLLLLFFFIALILALTVFKPKQPRTQLISATVDGVSPRISFPAVRIELNLTLDIKLLVENKNHASFRHGHGKSVLLYREKQVGEVDVYPGLIPAMGSTTVGCRLALEVDKMAEDMAALVGDVLGGEVDMETRTRIPGRINFLGIFKKHAVAISECQLAIGFPEMKVRRQECKQRTKL